MLGHNNNQITTQRHLKIFGSPSIKVRIVPFDSIVSFVIKSNPIYPPLGPFIFTCLLPVLWFLMYNVTRLMPG